MYYYNKTYKGNLFHHEIVGEELLKPEACNFIKKKLQYRCVPVNFAKFLRTAFFIEGLW